MKKDRLVIFHYHLLPGGVTSVIAKGIKGILITPAKTGLKNITVVSGGDPIGEEDFRRFMEEHRGAAKKRGITLEYKTLREIGYASADHNTWEEAEAAVQLADQLKNLFPDSIWWIHNYHIGKNPLFTQAVLLTARDSRDQRLLLQIHDFPENGRFANWTLLKERIPLPLYPAGPEIFYLTINQRDRRILAAAGLPEEQIVHLPNPVSINSVRPRIDTEEVKGVFEKRMMADFPGYRSGAPWGLYPVRTIRRKNILEAALGSLLFPEPLNLVVTLPGLSNQEKGYSGLVENLFRDGTIPGLWGTGMWKGTDAPPFEEMARASDLILSSSLQEGFGYFIIDALRWGKPLLSRRMDVLEELLPLLPGHKTALYDSLWIPPEKNLIQRWDRHAENIKSSLPRRMRHEIPNMPEAEAFLSPQGFDFSALSPGDQVTVLRRSAQDTGYRRDVEERNPAFREKAEATLLESRRNPSQDDFEALNTQWGLAAFGQRVTELISRENIDIDHTVSHGREKDILRAFTTPKNMRPLFFPYPEVLHE